MSYPTLTFHIDPPFTVDFSQYARQQSQQPQQAAENLSLSQKVRQASLSVIGHVSFFFVALSKSAYSTLSNAGTSFKYIVLGHYGSIWGYRPPADLYLAVFKIVIWVLSMGWCTLATTARLIYERNKDPARTQNLLTQFLDPEINASHIKTKESSIDVSGVPAEITINSLLALYDQIDFDHPDALNYMAPGSRTEYQTPYTKEDLKASLQKFANQVNGRVAFLGTPPAYDTPRLMAFYQQIEDAVRFSIHKASEKCMEAKENYEQFMTEHNQQIPVEEEARKKHDALKNAYKNALENQARIPINLAIAGKHCGARYMGESMELYDSFSGEASMGQATLEDALAEILAAKRKEIARTEIQIRLGTDTHKYNQYMSSLGHVLAIPGTANVIEHLSRSLDRAQYLKYFFEKYTVDCIIETVNNKVKTSQVFREKISDWLRDHPGDWNKQNIEQEVGKLLKELDSKTADEIRADFPIHANFLRLQALISYMKEKGAVFPNNIDDGWDEFITELFALDTAKEWFAKELAGKTPIEKATIKQDIKSLFSEKELGQILIQKVKDAITKDSPLRIEDFSQRILALQKVSALSHHIDPAVALRVVEGQKDLKAALTEHREQARGLNLLDQLIDNPEDLAKEGLPQQLMEWILVSQNVLNVQGG